MDVIRKLRAKYIATVVITLSLIFGAIVIALAVYFGRSLGPADFQYLLEVCGVLYAMVLVLAFILGWLFFAVGRKAGGKSYYQAETVYF